MSGEKCRRRRVGPVTAAAPGGTTPEAPAAAAAAGPWHSGLRADTWRLTSSGHAKARIRNLLLKHFVGRDAFLIFFLQHLRFFKCKCKREEKCGVSQLSYLDSVAKVTILLKIEYSHERGYSHILCTTSIQTPIL